MALRTACPQRAQFSKSRTMTATCARLAASATRVKSFRKASVLGGWTARGAGTGTVIELGDGCEEDEKLEAELPRVLWAGEEMGASIVRFVCACGEDLVVGDGGVGGVKSAWADRKYGQVVAVMRCV